MAGAFILGTILAAIEQTTKIMAAAHKGQHAAMGEVLRLLVRLFKQHPEDFWRGNKIQPGYWNEQKLLAARGQQSGTGIGSEHSLAYT